MTIESAYKNQEAYQARPDIREQLVDTDVIAFVGAMAVGKNHLMHASELPIVGTETTRQPRADDDKDVYSYSDLDLLLKAIEEKEVVQYGVALPKDIYASRLRDYTLGAPNVSDIWFDAVGPLENKGFRSVRTVSVLSPEDQWLSQLQPRASNMQIDKVVSRLESDRHSIRWSLAQHLAGTANHLLIIAAASDIDQNVEKIHAFTMGETVPPLADEVVQTTAGAMARTIRVMYDLLGNERLQS